MKILRINHTRDATRGDNPKIEQVGAYGFALKQRKVKIGPPKICKSPLMLPFRKEPQRLIK